MQEKVCKICEESKPLTSYPSHNTTKDRLGIYCRKCQYEKFNKPANYRLHKKLGSGIYYVKTDKGDYVGQSARLQRRKYEYQASVSGNVIKFIGAKLLEWKILEKVEEKFLIEREAYWIKKLQPTLNTQHNGNS